MVVMTGVGNGTKLYHIHCIHYTLSVYAGIVVVDTDIPSIRLTPHSHVVGNLVLTVLLELIKIIKINQ